MINPTTSQSLASLLKSCRDYEFTFPPPSGEGQGEGIKQRVDILI